MKMKKVLMKKMNKKGFSLVELLAVIVLLSIIAGLALLAYDSYYDNSKIKVYQNYEEGMQEAAMEYIIDTGDMPTTTTKLKLRLKYLVGDEKYNGKYASPPYISTFKSPKGSSDTCLDQSYVEVSQRPKQATTDGKVDYNKSFDYKVCLVCKEYKSEGC